MDSTGDLQSCLCLASPWLLFSLLPWIGETGNRARKSLLWEGSHVSYWSEQGRPPMPGQKITQNVPLIPAWQDSQTPQVPVRDAVASRICSPFPVLLGLVQGPRLFICNMSPTASFLQDILPLLLINFAHFPALATQLLQELLWSAPSVLGLW